MYFFFLLFFIKSSVSVMPEMVSNEQSAVDPGLEGIIRRNREDSKLSKLPDTVQDQVLETQKRKKYLEQQLLEVCLSLILIVNISF